MNSVSLFPFASPSAKVGKGDGGSYFSELSSLLHLKSSASCFLQPRVGQGTPDIEETYKKLATSYEPLAWLLSLPTKAEINKLYGLKFKLIYAKSLYNLGGKT